MLDPNDLRMLTAWCRQRALHWQALAVNAEQTVLLLEPRQPARPWQRMRLLAGDHGYLLEDEGEQLLASASDLPALLDAMDGGVADVPPLMLLRPTTAGKPRAAAFA